jgi:hypothetical protein
MSDLIFSATTRQAKQMIAATLERREVEARAAARVATEDPVSRVETVMLERIYAAFGCTAFLPVSVPLGMRPDWASVAEWQRGVMLAVAVYVLNGWTKVSFNRLSTTTLVVFDVPDPQADTDAVCNALETEIIRKGL